MSARFGRTELTGEQEAVLRRAVRLEWLTIGFLAVTVAMVALVVGNSQAMKAAWIEDMLSFAPPIAFLLAARVVNRPPNRKHPYGHHRSAGVAHLVAGVALFTMGAFLLFDSASGLLKAEHPPIGSATLFGQTIWLGWLMMAVMALTIPVPVIVGRIKMKLAQELHSKVLYADAAMNKADWMTAAGTIVGVGGIGLGLWWADAAAALFIAFDILKDGYKNMVAAIEDLMDARAMTFDDKRPHPLIGKIDGHLRSLAWVQDAGSRVRDEGHVFHVESFVVPRGGQAPPLDELQRAREGCTELDWKIQDLVLVLVPEVPEEAGGGSGAHQASGQEGGD